MATVLSWVAFVGCAAGLVFMMHALLRPTRDRSAARRMGAAVFGIDLTTASVHSMERIP